MNTDCTDGSDQIVALLTKALAIADRQGNSLLGAKLSDCLGYVTTRSNPSDRRLADQ